MNFKIFSNVKDLTIHNLRLGKPRKNENTTYAIIRNIDPELQVRQQVYLQSPSGHLGELQWDESNETAYLDLFQNNTSFIHTLNRLDAYFCKKIWDHRQDWGLAISTPLSAVENCWVPSLKTSALDYQKNSLKFKLDVKHGGEVEIFDQDNINLSLKVLEPSYPARALIALKGVAKLGDFFYLDLELKQLKVKVPEQVFQGCQISDSEDDLDRETIWDVYEKMGIY